MKRYQCYVRVSKKAAEEARRILATDKDFSAPGRRAAPEAEGRLQNEKAFRIKNPDVMFYLPGGHLFVRQRYDEAKYMCDYRLYMSFNWNQIKSLEILKKIADNENK